MPVDDAGIKRLAARMAKIADPDATPLMKALMDVIEADNRRGVLAGLDKDGNLMPPVTYRPKGPTVKITAKSAAKFRNNAYAGGKAGVFAGLGMHTAGVNNNLLPREYEQLTGPPLAPRRQFSRVITNLRLGFEKSADGRQWTAFGFWHEVVNAKGKPFLQYHFQGIRYRSWHGSMFKKRDLTGVRPEGQAKARKAIVAWMSDIIRTSK
jgi:hypothetical protein